MRLYGWSIETWKLCGMRICTWISMHRVICEQARKNKNGKQKEKKKNWAVVPKKFLFPSGCLVRLITRTYVRISWNKFSQKGKGRYCMSSCLSVCHSDCLFVDEVFIRIYYKYGMLQDWVGRQKKYENVTFWRFLTWFMTDCSILMCRFEYFLHIQKILIRGNFLTQEHYQPTSKDILYLPRDCCSCHEETFNQKNETYKKRREDRHKQFAITSLKIFFHHHHHPHHRHLAFLCTLTQFMQHHHQKQQNLIFNLFIKYHKKLVHS